LLFTRYRRHAGVLLVRERADCFQQESETFGHRRQGLPDGTAMPLGELQENLHLGEGLPLNVYGFRKSSRSMIPGYRRALAASSSRGRPA
jgi:hypothetical protein